MIKLSGNVKELKGLLRQVRNLPERVRPKAGLTMFCTAGNVDAKAGPSER